MTEYRAWHGFRIFRGVLHPIGIGLRSALYGESPDDRGALMQRIGPTGKASFIAACIGGFGFAAVALAGPENIRYPGDFASWQRYASVDRADLKQAREMYARPDVVKAVRDGKPVPDGAVLVMAIHAAKVDAEGTPQKDADGRFVKDRLVNVFVMEKRAGWGADYPDAWRNGNWEYAAFLPAGTPNEKANAGVQSCFSCHKPKEAQDYVFSMPALSGRP